MSKYLGGVVDEDKSISLVLGLCFYCMSAGRWNCVTWTWVFTYCLGGVIPYQFNLQMDAMFQILVQLQFSYKSSIGAVCCLITFANGLRRTQLWIISGFSQIQYCIIVHYICSGVLGIKLKLILFSTHIWCEFWKETKGLKVNSFQSTVFKEEVIRRLLWLW